MFCENAPNRVSYKQRLRSSNANVMYTGVQSEVVVFSAAPTVNRHTESEAVCFSATSSVNRLTE
jgi:hypothetical protein